MKVLADENIDAGIVEKLRASGHSVEYIAELESGLTDDEVLSLSANADALLLTSDKDFGEMVYRQKKASRGVLLLRLTGLSAERKSDLVVNAIRDHESEMIDSFCVLTPGTVRIRSTID